jgi:hypothetical protein
MARRFIKIDDPSRDTPRAFSDFYNPVSAELLRTLVVVYQAAASGAMTYDAQGRILTVTVTGLTDDGAGDPVTAVITYTYDDAAGSNTGVPDALWKENLVMEFSYDRDTGVTPDTVEVQTEYSYNPSQANRLEGYARTEV